MSVNIFKYAKKELSQDAFLMWLLDSFNSEVKSEKETSIAFINFLVKLKNDEKIEEVRVKPQLYKIDVTANIKTKYREISLFIEDKTTSDEHNQLDKYNCAINNIVNSEKEKPTDVKKIFYKTNSIDETERTRVEKAGWEVRSIESINDFWSKYLDSDHLFIKQYAEHVCELYSYSENIIIPSDNNIIAWRSFFDKVIVPTIRDKVDCQTFIYRNLYAAIKIIPIGRLDEDMPYLEIRSRDCISEKFNARILMYGVDLPNNQAGLKKIRDEIWKDESKGIFKGNYGEKKNRQVAHSPKGKFKYKNIDDFKNLILTSINEYLNIVSFWK